MAKDSHGYDAKQEVQTITQFTTTALQTIATAGADDSRVMEICVHSDDTNSTVLTVYMKKGAVSVPIKTVTVAANQGNVIGTPDRLRLLNGDSGFITGRLVDRDQNYYLVLQAGSTLEASLSTLSASKKVIIEVIQRDF